MKFGLGFFPTAEAISPGDLGRLAEERGHESLFFAEHTHTPASRDSPWPAGAKLPPKYARTSWLSGCPHARLAVPDTLRRASSSVDQIALLFGLPASYPGSVRHSPAARAGNRIAT